VGRQQVKNAPEVAPLSPFWALYRTLFAALALSSFLSGPRWLFSVMSIHSCKKPSTLLNSTRRRFSKHWRRSLGPRRAFMLFRDHALDAEDDIVLAANFIFLNANCFNGIFRLNKAGVSMFHTAARVPANAPQLPRLPIRLRY